MSNTTVYMEQGGGKLIVSDGGEIEIQSGGTLTVGGGSPTLHIGSSTTSAADSLAIPITHSLVLKTTGADAEALTLADGTAGQVLVVVLDTDGGGDGTLTPATSLAFGTIVFADAGDCASLMYVDDTVGWVILGVSGLTAQPTVTAPA